MCRKGVGPLEESAVHQVVKAAAEQAGLSAEISAPWLRHAHASHSLDHGAPIHLGWGACPSQNRRKTDGTPPQAVLLFAVESSGKTGLRGMNCPSRAKLLETRTPD